MGKLNPEQHCAESRITSWKVLSCTGEGGNSTLLREIIRNCRKLASVIPLVVRMYVRTSNTSKIINCSRISVYREYRAFIRKTRYRCPFFSDDANWPIREIIVIKRASCITCSAFRPRNYTQLHVTNATKRACIRINARS